MKKFPILFLSLLLTLPLAACGGKTVSEQEAIQTRLAEMEGYSAKATLTRQTPFGERTYETLQYYKADGEYRLELTAPKEAAGNYTVFDGSRICQYNPRVDQSIIRDVPVSQQRNELFLGSFIENYLRSEGVTLEISSLDRSKCVVMEAVIPGNDPMLSSEKLWVDRESMGSFPGMTASMTTHFDLSREEISSVTPSERR